ncbi:MAG: ImmA/IrrE family metallo-endopeptidase [Acidobacteriia bacterium]|nr:ImmA/IrrE family metallo-endopeptidase [Terriglobia bacterium]
MLLSFRYLSDDQFWFSFFHEAGHLLLHGAQGLFLESDDTPATKQEQEASDFAEGVLVSPQFREALLRLSLNGREVIRFAHRAGISPGIVVGQLQHHGKFTYRQLNNLKRRFRWEE